MDIMNSKKTLLSLINGGILGSPAAQSTVKFQFTTNLATAAGSQTAGALTFAADASGNAGIWAQGTLVSSAIQKVEAAAATDNKHGGKTITVTYIVANTGAVTTSTFDVIDEAGLEAYFSSSKTIALDDTTDKFEVITDGKTILVDESNGLKSGLKLVYVAGTAEVGASIQLQANDSSVINTIPVSNIIGNGVLDHSTYDKQKNELHLFFKTGQTGVFNEVVIPVGEILDINDIFIKNDSSIYLTATADTSVMNLGVLTHDVSTASDAEGGTGLADAWNVKQYVDSKSTDLSVNGQGDGIYINLEQDADNNKKLNASAFVNDLVYAAGTADSDPATLTGSAGLVDGAQAGTAISNFVNQRLNQKVATLDASIDSTGTTFVEVGVAEVDGKITNVKVTEHSGSITGTTTSLSGTAGIADAAATATAVKTYVDGQINALDASVDSDEDTYTKVGVKQENGVITDVVVSQTKSTITASANALSATSGIADGSEFATGVKTYVDGQINALDSELNIGSNDGSLNFDVSVVDGKIVEGHIDYVKSTVEFDDTEGLNLTATAGFVTGEAIAEIKEYIDAMSGSLDSQIEESDASNFVTVTTGIVDGALTDASSAVAVQYAEVTAAPGDITVSQNGIVKGDVLEAAIEGALKWTVI